MPEDTGVAADNRPRKLIGGLKKASPTKKAVKKVARKPVKKVAKKPAKKRTRK